jgi:tryptophan synthase alpha subunit
MYVDGKGSGGWKIAQNSGQTIYYQSANTTTGATGHLDSTNARACVTLRCITANTEWVVENTTGAITLV